MPDLGPELERIARAAPDRLAISDPDESLTYGELFSAARRLADTLRAAPAHSPRPVALLMPHRATAVAAIIGALLAGRPFCVLDPSQPRRRIERLVASIDPGILWVADEGLRDRLRAVDLKPSSPGRSPERERPQPPGSAAESPDGVCALYVTSGSTGAPKLVRYRHRATHHRATHYATAIGATSGDRFSLASPLWTAAAASHLFAALLSGASLHLLEPAALAPAALTRRIFSTRISVWHSTPSLFRRLAGAGLLDGNSFRVVRLGGEAMLAGDVALAREVCSRETLLVTGYSLTEANGAVTHKAVRLSEATPEFALDAGPPIDGIAVAVRERNGGPPGEEGEIVVVGDLLSGGYAGPEHSQRSMRFTTTDHGVALHTGDRGLLRGDGSLEVRDRDDGRLKIRGHRVDAREVEAAAISHPGVVDAAVIPFEARAGATAIALFVQGGGRGGSVSAEALVAHLEGRVPAEAIPSSVHVHDRLPVTTSEKIDRGRLARLTDGRETARRTATKRADPLVDHLAGLLAQALELDGLDPDEDFFALGGDSLAAVEVCAGVEAVYGISLEPAALLRHRTADALGEHVRAVLRGEAQVPSKVLPLNPGGDEVPLFVIPGAGSDATALVHFAEAIGPRQPVFVIQLPGADGPARPLTRMDRITAHCLEAMRATGVGPPYRIAGTSFGGVIAYAIAAELSSDELAIEYLGLFDAPAPTTRRRGPLGEPLRQFRRSSGLSARRVWRDPRTELRRIRTPLRNLVLGYGMTLSLLLGLRWRPSLELRFRYLRTGCAIAAGGWTPPPLPLPVHLYRCDSQPARLADSPLLGWDRHAHRIAVRPLPSRHGRHIRPPAVSHLAAAVADDLRASRAKAEGRLSPSGEGAGPPAAA